MVNWTSTPIQICCIAASMVLFSCESTTEEPVMAPALLPVHELPEITGAVLPPEVEAYLAAGKRSMLNAITLIATESSGIPGVTWDGRAMKVEGLPTDVSLEDVRVVNIILEHALKSAALVRARASYSGVDPTQVAYMPRGMPSGVVPTVQGIEFTALPSDQWPDSPIGREYLLVNYVLHDGAGEEAPQVWIGMSNMGGQTLGTMTVLMFGGGTHYYTVNRSGELLRVEYVGGFDP